MNQLVCKRDFVISLLLFGAAPLYVAQAEVGTATRSARPNILFVLSDDQSWLHTGAFGHKIVKTPAFDRIAREGVLFTHSFAACPSCTASRVSSDGRSPRLPRG